MLMRRFAGLGLLGSVVLSVACSSTGGAVEVPMLDDAGVDLKTPPDLMPPPPDLTPPPCGPATCPTGCCNGNVCESGTSTKACGKGAAICASCAGFEMCTGTQSCGLDPDHAWTLTIVDASISATTAAGLPWDAPTGAPDPYLKLDFSQVTSVYSDTYSPLFNYQISTTAAALLAGTRILEMDDKDLTSDDVIASGKSLKFSESELRAGAATWTVWGQVNSIRFTMAPK